MSTPKEALDGPAFYFCGKPLMPFFDHQMLDSLQSILCSLMPTELVSFKAEKEAGTQDSSEKEEKQVSEKSPTEKLNDKPSSDSLTPGTAKPESEVHNERGMNTE
jgi:hypothetical protein